jgi:hypothetical protein
MAKPRKASSSARPKGWHCAGCNEYHEDSRERLEASPGRWLCWPKYDKELQDKLAKARDTLA